MSIAREPIAGTLRTVWCDDENLRHINLEVDYEIEPYDPGDRVNPPVGGGVEIIGVQIIYVDFFDSSQEESYLRLNWRQVLMETLAHLVDCYEQSDEYKSIEDACRKHAESKDE